MKKKVLAVFMAVFVTVGTVLAPAETGSVYAADYRRADGGDYAGNGNRTSERSAE